MHYLKLPIKQFANKNVEIYNYTAESYWLSKQQLIFNLQTRFAAPQQIRDIGRYFNTTSKERGVFQITPLSIKSSVSPPFASRD